METPKTTQDAVGEILEMMHDPIDAQLRPLNCPIFDTEIYPERGAKNLYFMTRPIGENFEFSEEKKAPLDTCLHISGMIQKPIKFSILGFSVHIDSRTTDDDRAVLIESGLLRFYIAGAVPYLEIPLTLMPRLKIDIEPIVKIYDKNVEEIKMLSRNLEDVPEKSIAIMKRINELSNESIAAVSEEAKMFHKFNIGKRCLKIRPGEAFGMSIEFKNAPKISKPARIVAAMHGLKWSLL